MLLADHRLHVNLYKLLVRYKDSQGIQKLVARFHLVEDIIEHQLVLGRAMMFVDKLAVRIDVVSNPVLRDRYSDGIGNGRCERCVQ